MKGFEGVGSKMTDRPHMPHDLQTEMLEFHADLCTLALDIAPDTPQARFLDSLCERFEVLLDKAGVEFPQPLLDDGKVPF